MPIRRLRLLGLVVLAGPLCAGVVLAQPPEIPPHWLQRRAPSTDTQTVSFCVDPRDPGAAVDQAIAEAVNAALLLEPRVHVVDRLVVVEDDFERLYIDLVDNCAAYLGFPLYPGAYPGWLTFTRPYYEARFVILTDRPGWSSLGDIPPASRVGAVQGTQGDIRFLTLNNARPAAARWLRTPLGHPERAFDALMDGVVDALIVWEPWWWHLTRSRPELEDLRVLNAPEVSEPWVGVGA
ncbi:MAG: hypothetical protein R6W77_01280, partial [Trueperaceae bacterium]